MLKKLVVFTFLWLISFPSISQNSIEDLEKKLATVSDKNEKLEILDKLTKAILKNKKDYELTYFNEYVALAQDLKKYDLAAQKARFIIQHYTNFGKLDSTKYYVDKMLGYKEFFKDPTTEAHLLLKRASYFYNTDKYQKAIADYKRSGDIFIKENKGVINAADARLFTAQVYNDLNEFLNAVTNYEEAYKLYDELNDNFYKNFTLSELAGIYSKNGFHEKSISEREKVLQNAKEIKDYASLFYAYGNLAKIHQKVKNFDKVKKYIDSTKFYADSVQNRQQKVLSNLFLANLNVDYNLDLDNITEAEKYLEEAKTWVQKSSALEFFQRMNYEYQAKVYSKKKDYRKAEEALQKVLALKGQEGQEEKVKSAEKELAKIYGATRQYKKAFEHLNTYLQLEEANNKLVKDNTFLYYQSQFETQRKDAEILKKENDIQLLEKEKELSTAKRKVLWSVFLSIVVILLLTAYFIWKQGKHKRRALAKKIEKNKQALEEYTKQLLEKRRIQETLTEEIERLKEEAGSKNSAEEEIENLTSVKILTNEDWYNFKEKFSSVYPDFFRNIKEKGYSLTKAEERLLALEKLYLDTNQIASMLAISNTSVVKSRFRLRKKINVPKGISTLHYLEAS